jgi:hypothetical protein
MGSFTPSTNTLSSISGTSFVLGKDQGTVIDPNLYYTVYLRAEAQGGKALSAWVSLGETRPAVPGLSVVWDLESAFPASASNLTIYQSGTDGTAKPLTATITVQGSYRGSLSWTIDGAAPATGSGSLGYAQISGSTLKMSAADFPTGSHVVNVSALDASGLPHSADFTVNVQ